ncbi:hypothetical protein [Serratia aquatilis]|uniref:Secreted protein n=1 Tax=Serratia aquatilis TaxID=1737515 RepID=A0ABV6EIE3_9GAMM
MYITDIFEILLRFGKMFKISLVLFYSLLSTQLLAKTVCGPYTLDAVKVNDGWVRINGAKPESQKITFLKAKEDYDNIKMVWRMATNQPGLWIAMEYIKRDGKAFLNTQQLRASMNAPRVFGTYDCVRIKD